MSQDKEREIQLQFLEEALDYLDTIESALLGLAGSHIDGQKMDAVLRAAHSVKGGAGMMGFQTLSHLAHRLEDSFKVLKAQKNSIQVDGELEGLLLAGVDRLRQVLTLNRQGADVDQQWVATVGNPVFDQLHSRLGDPVADDAATMLSSDDGTNVAALLFETEVEGCLSRLEGVLADPQAPCLEEELSIMAQELGGLGEMLQLAAFSSLCESVLQQLEVAPGQVREIAQLALSAWRRSQALVLVGQVNSLPTAIAATLIPPTNQVVVENWSNNEVVAAEFDVYTPWESPTKSQVSDEQVLEEAVEAFQWNALSEPTSVSPTPMTGVTEDQSLEVFATDFDVYTSSEPSGQPIKADNLVNPATVTGPRTPAPLFKEGRGLDYDDLGVPSNPARWREVNSESTATTNPESQDNTVRIPVRQLDRVNDLFGELTIERNGLGLHLERLRNLMENLGRRVGALEQSNARLRTASDTVTTQGAVPRGMKSFLMSWSGDSDRDPLGGPVYLSDHNHVFPPVDGEELGLNGRFDALEMDRYSDLHLLSMEVMETIVQIQEISSDIGLTLEDTDQTARELNQTSKQLQTNLTRIRMRPLSELVGRFSRSLRDLSLQYGKLVELKVLGKGTLIDRSILEALSDPLMHLVRNAFDHGIEDPATRTAQGKPPQGVIEIKAAHRGNQTIITVSDDGNGINLNKIRARAEAMGLDGGLLAAASSDELLSLIFEPGFSTADQVTALSGRGVGMDVVRNNLKKIRGDIRVDTQPGRGTTFTLCVPFTLSVARVLLVESNSMLLAFPTDVIEELLLLNTQQVLKTPGSEVLNWDGDMVPLTRLGSWLTFHCPRRVTTPEGVASISEPTVLMISQGDQLVGLQVDRCWGEREVAIRQVEGSLAMPPGMSSCTILGDGKVVPLIDVSELLRWIASCGRSISSDRNLDPMTQLVGDADQDPPPPIFIPPSQKDTILVVDDSINVRRFLALALEKAGYLVEQAKDGQDAVEKLLGGLTVSAVICDIEMPRLDGYGFLARIKSDPVLAELPIAMLTSRSGDKHRQLAITLGAAAYFSKPYNERELLKTLKQITTENQVRKPIPSGII
jgi:chemosensory pili system protein ChpA (sensor histidine kinase/response regulator)